MSQRMWTALLQRSRSPLLWACLAIAVLYLVTLFPGVGGRINGGDSAKFQFIGIIGGIGHPPGSPLYLMLNALWVRVPWPCSPALRVTLLSLLFAMISLVVLGRALAQTFGRRAALCGVIALGLGPLFWTLATEAELYTLNAALVAGSCAAALRFDKTGAPAALFACFALSLLGCANHLTCVMLLPAAGYLLWSARAQLTRRQLLGLGAVALLSAATYAYVPLRAHSAAPYSEWLDRRSAESFWHYVTASEFQAGFQQLTLDKLLARLPVVAAELQKQWAWPVLLLIPFGLTRLRVRSPRGARFVQIALAGLMGFALLYKIPDPAGFYLPIVTLLALPLALACSAGRHWRLGVLALCLGVSAWQHLQGARRLVGNELIYSLGDHKNIAWDLDDVFERMPRAAYFAQPCEAYGCVELINYFRFADSTVQRRDIRFAQLPGVQSAYYAFAPMQSLPWDAGQREVICTIRKDDAKSLRKHGAAVRTIERPARRIAGKEYPGVPIFCTEPGLAQNHSLRNF
jgi:hypothetical protein